MVVLQEAIEVRTLPDSTPLHAHFTHSARNMQDKFLEIIIRPHLTAHAAVWEIRLCKSLARAKHAHEFDKLLFFPSPSIPRGGGAVQQGIGKGIGQARAGNLLAGLAHIVGHAAEVESRGLRAEESVGSAPVKVARLTD